jgi:FdhD protein
LSVCNGWRLEFGVGMSSDSKKLNVTRLSQGCINFDIRDIAGEVAMALTYNGVSYVVMMVTPADLDDFAMGFTLSEGVVANFSDIGEIEVHNVDAGLLAHIEIPGENLACLLKRRRNMVGQAGCGLCGVEDLESAIRPLEQVVPGLDIPRRAIFNALAGLAERQSLNARTGGVHAAAFVGADGKIKLVREDVGRHNALDKLVGAMARTGADPMTGFLLLTSRCSYELVQKAVTFGFSTLVTISVPTTLAVELAKEYGLTLICLAREDSVLVMNDPGGIYNSGSEPVA